MYTVDWKLLINELGHVHTWKQAVSTPRHKREIPNLLVRFWDMLETILVHACAYGLVQINQNK